MALPSLNNLVKARLTYLPDGEETETLISGKLIELFYEMQSQTGKTEEEVETEGSYTSLQRLFFADYAAYELLKVRIMAKTTGTAGADAEVPAFLKRAKADVVESEFEQIKGSQYTAADLLEMLKTSVCSKARQLNYSIPVCQDDTGSSYPGKFIFIPRKC